jgi:DNA/RNA endonuclease YhcR with UshA esterase domain
MIYFAASQTEPETINLEDLNQEFVGRTVAIEGQIKSKKVHEDGHIFLTISDGSKSVQTPIFSNVAQHLDSQDFAQGSKLRVVGLVDNYREQMQVIPRKPGDLIFLSS